MSKPGEVKQVTSYEMELLRAGHEMTNSGTSSGVMNENYYAPYTPYYPPVCPGCGRCPYCGRPGYAQPFYPHYPQVWCSTNG